MRWSNQTIEQAIQTAKERNAIFVVYVQDDTKPTPLDNIIESWEVTTLLMNNNFVAVRICSSSQSYRDFAAIYQLVPIPSLFFIGNNGWPLEIISGELPQSAVVQRINSLLQMAENTSESSSGESPGDPSADPSEIERSSEQNSSKNSVSSSVTSTVTSTDTLTFVPLQPEETEEVLRSEDRISSDPGPSTSSSSDASSNNRSDILDPHSQYDNNTPNSSSSQNIPPSDTVSEAGVSDSSDDNKKQGKQKNSLETSDSESTPPNPLNTEINYQPEPRRRVHFRSGLTSPQERVGRSSNGEQVPRVPQDPDSSVTGFLASFRGWVRSILQRGRGTGPQTGRLMNEGSSESFDVTSTMSHPRIYEPSTRPSGDPGYACIQFRLPDGSTHSTSFPTQTTIREVREYVQNNIALPFREFRLSTSYPRIEFADEHLDATIAGLGLVPRTVILIIPSAETSRPVLSSASDVIWTVVSWPFTAIFSLAGYVNFVLFGEPQAEIRDQSASHQQPRTSQPSRNPSERNPSITRRRTSSSSVQREGNVYRLSNRQDDSDDENNTWNGNSTQQM